MGEYNTQDYEQIPYQVAELNKQIILLKAENKEIRKINDANAKLMVKLRDCLGEIEKVSNNYCEACNNKNKKDCMYCTYGKILQLIEKVKKGEE